MTASLGILSLTLLTGYVPLGAADTCATTSGDWPRSHEEATLSFAHRRTGEFRPVPTAETIG